ncbi:MAG TPA: PAS-domain containing protein [Geminicoccaceae bacterium]|nr:PAS-domain containing protein [Geminicoccus sp.]HMU52288.1 PAS-domain containing protein [Geminicoccaceae bacterium]
MPNDVLPPGLATVAALDPELVCRLLDQLEIACCVYDADDRIVAWNATYLTFFPEQCGGLGVGVAYEVTLARFFESNLPDAELPHLQRHVAAGVARHRSQQLPFIFQRKSGRWVRVASLPIDQGGRVRIWRDVTVEQSGAQQRTTARAVAAIDVAYALFDAEGGFVSANKRYHELFPDIGDLAGTGIPYSRHLERIAQSAPVPEDAEGLRQLAVRPDPRAEPLSVPVMVHREGGGWLQLEERYDEDGGMVCLWADATRQAEAEARIVRLEAYLRDAIEAIPEGLLLFDRDERLVLVNRRLAEVAPDLAAAMQPGAGLSALIGWRASIAPAGAPPPDPERLRRAAAGEELPLPDGRWLKIEALRTSNGDLLLLLADITPEKSAEAELQRQRDAMHQSEKLAAMGALLAGVAHELNNPLSIVVGRAALLQSAAADPNVVAQARTIAGAADRCARIVRTFLELARQRPPARRQVDLAAMVTDTMSLLSYGLRAAGVVATIEIAPGLPELWADPDQLAQVLINLVVNAQHALAQRPEPRNLAIGVRHDGRDDALVLTVADNGPGIAPAIRSRIFDPFFTTKPVGEGTGLGLAMSLGHVRSHGGTLDIETTPGGGATFVVRLPRTVPVPAVAEPTGPPPAPSRRRVLIVDDEAEIAELLRDILLADGHAVSAVTDGESALARLAAEPFDIVLSDVMMPGMDGPTLWRELRKRRPEPFPAFVLVTGDSLRLDRVADIRETGCAVIEKPFEPGEVRKVVREELHRADRARVQATGS